MRRICARCIPHMIDEKRPGMLQTAFLYHDNTTSRRAAQTTKTIKRLRFGLIDHPLTHQTWPLVMIFSISIDQQCFERNDLRTLLIFQLQFSKLLMKY